MRIRPPVFQGGESKGFAWGSHVPEVTGNESDNYPPAAENLDLPILPPLSIPVCGFLFSLFSFETILTFHFTAGNCREQTTAAQTSETKEKRKKEKVKAPLLRDFFFKGGRERFCIS